MKNTLQTVFGRVARQARGWANATTGQNPAGTMAGLDALKPRDLNQALALARAVIIALLVVQGLRSGVAVIRTAYLLGVMEVAESEPPLGDNRDTSEMYKPILEKGVLGVPPPEMPLQLFGVLGSTALMGNSPDQIQEYAMGAEVPGGEKVVAVGVESVELEKEGQKRTLTVFPELKQQQ